MSEKTHVDLYRRPSASYPVRLAYRCSNDLGDAGIPLIIAGLAAGCLLALVIPLAFYLTTGVANYATVPWVAALLSLVVPATMVYGRLTFATAPKHLADAVEQAEHDVTDVAPADVKQQTLGLRPAAIAAARQLSAALDAEKRLRELEPRAFESSYETMTVRSNGYAKNPELWAAIKPQRDAVLQLIEDAEKRVDLVREEADTLARIGRKWAAEFGTPNYDFLIQARNAALATPSVDVLSSRVREAGTELEITTALDEVRVPAIA